MCGADTWVDVEEFGHAKREWLETFLNLPNGIPSRSTFERVFAALAPAGLQSCLLRWLHGCARALGLGQVAIDGKTLRHSGSPAQGLGPLHLVSVWATQAHLSLGQVAVDAKSNEITAIPRLLRLLDLRGALVTIDAMGCQVEIADKIVAHKADYLLALKGNQPTLEADVEDYFRTAPADELVSKKPTVEKGHGRIETRTYTASSKVDWIGSERSYPGQPRFKNIKTIVKVHARVEYADRCSFDTRYYISSAHLDIERIARGARDHWGVESMHWLLDVEFKDDLSRYRTGHGAKNMAIVRRFALGLVRANKAKGSVKTRRKTAGWSPEFLLQILQLKER